MPNPLFALGATRWGTLALALALSGCATTAPPSISIAIPQPVASKPGGVSAPVTLHDSPAAREQARQRVQALMQSSLSADAAVEIALLQHPGLQADLAGLGVSQAQWQQSLQLPNPGFTFVASNHGSDTFYERGWSFNLMQLLTRNRVQAERSAQLEQMRHAVVLKALQTADAARKAHIQAVAAEQQRSLLRQSLDAAEAAAELAQRMFAVGNFSKLQRDREQLNLSKLKRQWRQAALAVQTTRSQLVAALGVDARPDDLVLPTRLPDLPLNLPSSAKLQQWAIDQRLDVRMARQHAEVTAQRLGLTQVTRYVDVLEVGWSNKTSANASTEFARDIRLELPIFDWGEAREAQAQATYLQALQSASAVALKAQQEVLRTQARWQALHAQALHEQSHELPLLKAMADEQVLRYNGMLIGVFELLADARERQQAVMAHLKTLTDFWLAQSDLELVLRGPVTDPSATALAGESSSAASSGAH